jgi:hypothetical protein
MIAVAMGETVPRVKARQGTLLLKNVRQICLIFLRGDISMTIPTLTSKAQGTLKKEPRKHLKVGSGDQIEGKPMV